MSTMMLAERNVMKVAEMSEEGKLRNFFRTLQQEFQWYKVSCTQRGCSISYNAKGFGQCEIDYVEVVTSKGRKVKATCKGVVFYEGSMDDENIAREMYVNCPD